MKEIGLLGGSFNPVHVGHIILAGYIVEHSSLDEIWFVLSPENPLKSQLLASVSDLHRLNMLKIALSSYDPAKLNICDIELTMPRPSYTISTLLELEKTYPEYRFRWIIGSDNWQIFQKWKDHDTILRDFGLIVYPRLGYDFQEASIDNVQMISAPLIDISSTMIRNGLMRGADMSFFLPHGVDKYIKLHKLYS